MQGGEVGEQVEEALEIADGVGVFQAERAQCCIHFWAWVWDAQIVAERGQGLDRGYGHEEFPEVGCFGDLPVLDRFEMLHLAQVGEEGFVRLGFCCGIQGICTGKVQLLEPGGC